MATCLSAFSESTQFVELVSGATNRDKIDTTKNAVYILNNELTQSVFFSIRSSGSTQTTAITLTIYNAATLAIFGSLNITQSAVNSSFTISQGRFYVCIRPMVGSYDIELTPTFISYSSTATFVGRGYFGYSSTSVLEVKKAPSMCARRLHYELIDGMLPTGIVLNDNGLVRGTLPILDCDPYNDDLPTSASWYHQLSDSEYVTSWGRAYRFKVRLSLYDDREKTDEEWFYISILNNFSKNLGIIDSYEVLSDSKVATFEERVILDTMKLCPTCEVVKVDDIAINEDIEISAFEKATGSTVMTSSSYDKLIKNKVSNDVYNAVEEYVTEDNDVILFDDPNAIENIEQDEDTEMFVLNDTNMFNNERLILEYYTENYDTDYDFVVALRDSCMFQTYLLEKKYDSNYIDMDVVSRFEYKDIVVSYNELDRITYIVLKNTPTMTSYDNLDMFNDDYIENHSKLPITPYSFWGFVSEVNLTVPGK